jgi:hypothetical protein
MKISHVLARAAKLVERNGWCRGMRDGKRRCALAAIGDAQPGSAVTATPAYRFFVDFFPGECSMVGYWNDARGRTGPEVVTWLASAAEYARVRGE